MNNLKINSQWFNPKNNKVYSVLYIANEKNHLKQRVVYKNIFTSEVFTKSIPKWFEIMEPSIHIHELDSLGLYESNDKIDFEILEEEIGKEIEL